MSLQYAYFENLETKEQMQVQFNPTELNFSKSAQFAEIAIPGLDAPIQQFIRGGTETLTVELFFDSTDSGMGADAKSVTDDNNGLLPVDRFCGTEKFYQLVKQNPKTHAPPRCRFGWGEPNSGLPGIGELSTPSSATDPQSGLQKQKTEKAVSNAPFWFTCIVESIDRKFLLFSPSGIPLRARLTVKLREYQTLEQMIAKLETADHTKVRILKQKQRLDQLAAQEYDTPTEWRRIAIANNVDDPRRIAPGTSLVVPAIQVESVIRSDRL
ncbi:CIS tube protein [Floridanema aerugineum]|uniref:LysM domain-containing protein n=1 Tax=Floridaenema aerugineum BLCC-F46 TaxID=3153654 RepID=A0ABV4XHJ9_9CYAN